RRRDAWPERPAARREVELHGDGRASRNRAGLLVGTNVPSRAERPPVTVEVVTGCGDAEGGRGAGVHCRAARDVVVALRVARLAPHDDGDEGRVAAEGEGAERGLDGRVAPWGPCACAVGWGTTVGTGRGAEIVRHPGVGPAPEHLEVDEPSARQARRRAA